MRRDYLAHRDGYATPELRFVDVVSTRTEPQAERAASQLRRGRSSDEVVRDGESPSVTLPFRGVKAARALDTRTQRMVKSLDEGDVATEQTSDGWYVVHLVDLSLSRPLAFVDATLQVQQDLQERFTKRAYRRINARLRAKDGNETRCAEKYSIPECA